MSDKFDRWHRTSLGRLSPCAGLEITTKGLTLSRFEGDRMQRIADRHETEDPVARGSPETIPLASHLPGRMSRPTLRTPVGLDARLSAKRSKSQW